MSKKIRPNGPQIRNLRIKISLHANFCAKRTPAAPFPVMSKFRMKNWKKGIKIISFAYFCLLSLLPPPPSRHCAQFPQNFRPEHPNFPPGRLFWVSLCGTEGLASAANRDPVSAASRNPVSAAKRDSVSAASRDPVCGQQRPSFCGQCGAPASPSAKYGILRYIR